MLRRQRAAMAICSSLIARSFFYDNTRSQPPGGGQAGTVA